ncbi:MAG: glycosyltransferase [bacterium]
MCQRPEGTPNPALEAAACGCTVVSTPVGTLPELIRDAANGYLVEPLRVQLMNSQTTACWQSDFIAGDVVTNRPGRFKARSE